MRDFAAMRTAARIRLPDSKWAALLLSVMVLGCGSRTTPEAVTNSPLTIELVTPVPDSEFEPKGEVRCLLRVVGPPDEPLNVLVTTGIWKSDTQSITTFGQVIDAVDPDGVHEAEAILVAPQEPGRYTVKATVASRNEAGEITNVESEPVSVSVTRGG
ncbi:hypothetical protein AB1L88_03715 [Tautonia sp. JC769]|uniref:hypothetical protein n=1 Tax=Tautonia sp. JC769 TaxID=3232135 RepID=UPI003459B67E